MKSLQEFYNEVDTRNNVKAFLIQELEKMAIERIFASEDVSGFAEARELIDTAFEKMEEMFAPQAEPREPYTPA